MLSNTVEGTKEKRELESRAVGETVMKRTWYHAAIVSSMSRVMNPLRTARRPLRLRQTQFPANPALTFGARVGRDLSELRLPPLAFRVARLR